MRRASMWVTLAALAACAIYGLVHERLFDQYLWTPQGVRRLVRAGLGFWAVSGLLIWLRPRWLAPVAGACVAAYSVWWCSRFFEAVAPLAVMYFLGSSFLLGRWIARKADGITALLLGLAVWIFAISIVVRFPVNTRAVYAVAFLIPYLLAWREADPRPAWGPLWSRRADAAALAVLLFVLLMNWLIALKPEVSSDGLAMHLAIPMAVAHDARWAFDFQRYTWALMPMGGDWAFTAVYLLGGEAAARLLNFALLVAIAAMVYQASRRWLPSPPAFLAAALFVSSPLVQLVTGSLFVENVWTAMIVGGALALCRGELVWAGVLLGAALSTKVGTTAFLIPAAVIGGFVLRKRWRTAVLAMVVFAMFAAPPYVNAWWKTGNPMYPFFNNVFKSPYFDKEPGSVQDVRFRQTLTWKTPYEATFRSGAFFEGHNGSLGFQYFLLLVPLLLMINRKSPRAFLLLGIVGSALTFGTLPNLRYLYPALPLLSIAIAWLISEIPAMLVVILALTALNVWFFPAASWYHSDFALFRRTQVEEYLKVAAPQRRLIEYLNRTAPGEPVAFLSGSPIAGLYGRAYSDQWRTYEFWKRLIGAHSPEEEAAMFHELGIRHVITPVPVETDYLVVRHFVEQSTTPTGVSNGRYSLLEVLPEPVPLPKQTTSAAAPAVEGAYDDLDGQIEYTGAWTEGREFKEASAGSITFSHVPGDTLRLVFKGSAVTYVYTKARNRGIAQVTIDGRERDPINLYSRKTQWQAKTVFGDLGGGPHTIEIRVLERKDPRSSNYYVDLDQFLITQN